MTAADLKKSASNLAGQSVEGLKGLGKIGEDKTVLSKAATAIKQIVSNVSQTFKNIIK